MILQSPVRRGRKVRRVTPERRERPERSGRRDPKDRRGRRVRRVTPERRERRDHKALKVSRVTRERRELPGLKGRKAFRARPAPQAQRQQLVLIARYWNKSRAVLRRPMGSPRSVIVSFRWFVHHLKFGL